MPILSVPALIIARPGLVGCGRNHNGTWSSNGRLLTCKWDL